MLINGYYYDDNITTNNDDNDHDNKTNSAVATTTIKIRSTHIVHTSAKTDNKGNDKDNNYPYCLGKRGNHYYYHYLYHTPWRMIES